MDRPENQNNAFRAARLLGVVAIASGIVLATETQASAQAAYGSYIGLGASLGLSSGSGDESSSSGAVIAARYRILEIPLSVRAQVLVSDATAIVPTVSYDIPIDWNTDVYIGAGVAFQDGNSSTSPIGNQTAFVIQPGIDYSFPNSDFVLFGNAIIAFDAYRESGDTAASLQGGVGLRF
jgi:hypothetical protein